MLECVQALGAKRRDILSQFLVESTTLAVVGASLGVAIGFGLAKLIAAVSPLTAEQAIALDRVARLQTRSAALEELLGLLGERPALQRAGTALPIDTLESQVQWLDHRISSSTGGGDAREAEQLWRDRVDTLDSLVRLRYVESQQLAM